MFKLKMTGYTRRSRTVIVSFALILICLPAAAMAGKVTDWNLVATTAENNQGSTNNAIIAIDCTYMHIAVYDAVSAIDGTHAPFAVQPSSVPAGASKEAAAVEAAYRVLRFLIPAQAAYLDGQYTLSLASIPDGTAKTDGMAVSRDCCNVLVVTSGRRAKCGNYLYARQRPRSVDTDSAGLRIGCDALARVHAAFCDIEQLAISCPGTAGLAEHPICRRS